MGKSLLTIMPVTQQRFFKFPGDYIVSHSPEQERLNQIREASRLSEGDEQPIHRKKTLHLRQSSRPSKNSPAPRARHTPKGHDAKLKAWQADGRYVEVGFIFGFSDEVSTVAGVITESDRYTITIRQSSGDEMLIYKHAISAIMPSALNAPPEVGCVVMAAVETRQ